MSSIVQSSAIAHQSPGHLVAMPFLPSPLQQMKNGFPSVHFSLWCTEKKSQGAKSVNMEDVHVFECIYWEETTRAKGRCELGHCPDAASRLCSSRDSAASSARFVALSLC